MTTNNQQDDKMRMAFERAKKGIEMPVYTTEYNPFIKTSIDCETYALGWFIHGYQAALASRAQPDLISVIRTLGEGFTKIADEGFYGEMNTSAQLVIILDEHKDLADAMVALAAPFLEDTK